MINTRYTPSQLGVRPAPALVQQLLVGAFGWMFAGLLVSAAVAFVVTTSTSLLQTVAQWWLPLILGQFGLVIAIQAGIRRFSPTTSLALFFVYAATMGLTLGVIVWSFTSSPTGTTSDGGAAVATAFFSTAAMFGAAAVYGAVAKRDLTKLGGILFMGLIGLLVAMVVNIFVASSTLEWIISIGGVGLFAVLTAYDVQRIARGDYAAITGSPERGSIIAALHLYLDFINMFLFMLRIFGGSRS